MCNQVVGHAICPFDLHLVPAPGLHQRQCHISLLIPTWDLAFPSVQSSSLVGDSMRFRFSPRQIRNIVAASWRDIWPSLPEVSDVPVRHPLLAIVVCLAAGVDGVDSELTWIDKCKQVQICSDPVSHLSCRSYHQHHCPHNQCRRSCNANLCILLLGTFRIIPAQMPRWKGSNWW